MNRYEANQRLLDACMEVLTGESPDVDADGNPTDWAVIGGVRLGQKLIVKAPDGTPLFEVSTRPMNQDLEDPGAVYPVLILRGKDGEILKLTLDFTRHLGYSNQPEGA